MKIHNKYLLILIENKYIDRGIIEDIISINTTLNNKATIKLGIVAEEEDLNRYITNLRKILTFLPEDIMTYSSKGIFDSKEGK